MLQIFAHAGVEHATPAEAAQHASAAGTNWPVIVSVTSVIVIVAILSAKLLSSKEKADD